MKFHVVHLSPFFRYFLPRMPKYLTLLPEYGVLLDKN